MGLCLQGAPLQRHVSHLFLSTFSDHAPRHAHRESYHAPPSPSLSAQPPSLMSISMYSPCPDWPGRRLVQATVGQHPAAHWSPPAHPFAKKITATLPVPMWRQAPAPTLPVSLTHAHCVQMALPLRGERTRKPSLSTPRKVRLASAVKKHPPRGASEASELVSMCTILFPAPETRSVVPASSACGTLPVPHAELCQFRMRNWRPIGPRNWWPFALRN